MFRTLKDAEALAGTLGKPSKMPGYSYGLPAKRCIVGASLVRVAGSVCSKCYALKGRYVFPNVLRAQEKRFYSLQDFRWVDALVFMITTRDCLHFRWHDSGDLQSVGHLENICEVARRCPLTKFWIPTREKQIVLEHKRAYGDVPDNLIVRVSATMIDGPAPVGFANTSTVVKISAATCPAPQQDGVCGTCRKCWSKEVANVSYAQH